jgi:hypothetical protein
MAPHQPPRRHHIVGTCGGAMTKKHWLFPLNPKDQFGPLVTGKPWLLTKNKMARAIASLGVSRQASNEYLEEKIDVATKYFWIARAINQEKTRTGKKENHPSSLERQFRSLDNALAEVTRIITKIKSQDIWPWLALQIEATKLVKHHYSPPLRPEFTASSDPEALADWSLDEADRTVVWLRTVAGMARDTAGKKKRLGGRVNRPDHKLVKDLALIYREATGEKPAIPNARAKKKSSRNNFLNFCEKVFDEIDERETLSIAKLISRVLKPN